MLLIYSIIGLACLTLIAAARGKLLRYFEYLLLFPIGSFFESRAQWGLVRHEYTRLPIDLAVVELMSAETGRILSTQITDPSGRFFFRAPEGAYRISVKKEGFARALSAVVTLTGIRPLTPHFDLAPLGPTVFSIRAHRRDAFLGRMARFLSVYGFWAAFLFMCVSPTREGVAVTSLAAACYLLWRRLLRTARPLSAGKVLDGKTKKPIIGAVVYLHDRAGRMLLGSQVTDHAGAYWFVVGPNVYTLRAQHPAGFESPAHTIDTHGRDHTAIDEVLFVSRTRA